MIFSMTGYGGAQHAADSVSYALEIRSVNNRYLKASIKLPEYLQFLEINVDRLLRERLQRGSVIYVLRMRNDSQLSAYEINRGALEHYVRQIGQVALPAGVAGTVDFGTLLGLPGVCQSPELDEETRERYWTVVRKLTTEALDQLLAMRRQEGEALWRDMLGHCEKLQRAVAEVAERAPLVVQEYLTKLRDRVGVLLADAKLQVDEDALLRELAVYSERCDVSEELARLRSHVDQFLELGRTDEHPGRTLDFLAQEMLREANTIGSKSNDALIARKVVEIKGGIDRLKEQIQNVE